MKSKGIYNQSVGHVIRCETLHTEKYELLDDKSNERQG